MIIIRIFGGLGNQLFQFAAAYALAQKHRTELKVDVTAFEEYTLRGFELPKIIGTLSVATGEEINALKATSTVGRLKARLTPYPNRHFYKQSYFHYDPKFFSLGKDVYLQGYFQSEKYFLSGENLITKTIQLQHAVSEKAKLLAKKLQSVESVAIHVRRGDYNNPVALKTHGVLPLRYYREAIEKIKEKQGPVQFFLFSDDPASVAQELNLPDAVVVSNELSQSHFEDLYLMSHCRHNIIANSSFSWWGAWLNNHPGKMVIAPKNWFNQGPKDTQDLLPESWLKT